LTCKKLKTFYIRQDISEKPHKQVATAIFSRFIVDYKTLNNYFHLQTVHHHMVFQITYSSVAKPGLSIIEIEEIITQAKQYNSTHDITGCLIYNNGYFLQILEGEKQLVMILINKIKLDDRHDHFTILSEGETNLRTFKEWAMAYYHDPLNAQLNSEVQEIKAALLEFSNSSKKPNFALKVFWYNVKNLLSEKGYYKPDL